MKGNFTHFADVITVSSIHKNDWFTRIKKLKEKAGIF